MRIRLAGTFGNWKIRSNARFVSRWNQVEELQVETSQSQLQKARAAAAFGVGLAGGPGSICSSGSVCRKAVDMEKYVADIERFTTFLQQLAQHTECKTRAPTVLKISTGRSVI